MRGWASFEVAGDGVVHAAWLDTREAAGSQKARAGGRVFVAWDESADAGYRVRMRELALHWRRTRF